MTDCTRAATMMKERNVLSSNIQTRTTFSHLLIALVAVGLYRFDILAYHHGKVFLQQVNNSVIFYRTSGLWGVHLSAG